MERSERIGFGVAAAGHLVLFGLLSVGFLATPNPELLKPTPIEVSLVEDVGLEAQAPQAVTPPAQSRAPEIGPPEEAPPPAPSDTAPEPDPAPPLPQPKAAPPPEPAPKAPPRPKKAAAAPAPVKAKIPPKRQAPAPTPAKTKPAPAKMAGTNAAATRPRPRGSRLGDDFLKGISDQPAKSKSVVPSAAKIDARALASIVQAIARQIQPCADRQVNPGPGANEIVTLLNLRLNVDGTLAATPSVVRQSGTTDQNRRYARRVIDLGVAAFKGCSPLRLPAEFYSTPNGGWNNINYNWQLR